MPVALLQPGVYIEEVSSGVRSISGVATSIALFVGWAPKGPLNKALRVFSFADYERAYGGLDSRSAFGHSVKHFFDNGGSDAYIIRIALTTDGTPTNNAKAATASIAPLTFEASSPGKWAERYRVESSRRIGDATRFTINIQDKKANNATVETFANLSVVTTDPRYVLTAINGRSAFIDKLTIATPAAVPADGNADLVGGQDGTVIGPSDASFRTTLSTLFDRGGIADRIDLFNIVCVPQLSDSTAIKALLQKILVRRAFLIVDPAETDNFTSVQGLPTAVAVDEGRNGAVYFPWVQAPDPLQEGALRAFPPCGFMAGTYARTDAQRGVWKAPAGVDATISGAAGLKETLSDSQNGVLNPLAVNCLRSLPVYGNVIWGARTLHGQNDRGSEWKYVPVRRMALFLEESLFRGTQWVVFEPNDEPLWAQIRLNVGAFMQGLFRQGAFQGTTPKQAYFVKCDRETTTQADINLGIVNIHVGFAPLKPAEFVVLRIQQIAGELTA
jgi:uncharacterized protein